MDKPYYPHKPISDIKTLSKTLGITEGMLHSIANKAADSYTEFTICSKGKDRTVYEPKFILKKLQKRINSRIFEHVRYPLYLHGGIRDLDSRRDYVENAKIHSTNKALHVINLDIKSFYDNIKSNKVHDIYKYFFKFPDPVCDMLTQLTTYKNKVPQGACTSSYLANLVFFNSEYSLVSKFRSQKIAYTRLLDDISLSTPSIMDESTVSDAIKSVIAMFKKYGLKYNKKKTTIESNKHKKGAFEVTGLWIGHINPKTRRDERRYIRTMVHKCEQEFVKDFYSEQYHELWNKTSGLVAKLARLNQSNYKALRARLSLILPMYDESSKIKIIRECRTLIKKDSTKQLKYGTVDGINKIYSRLGILARNEKTISRMWRKKLRSHFRHLPTKREIWL